MLNNFYVDDCLKSVPTEEDAKELVTELCKLLSLGGFRLTKWISNRRSVLESIPIDERAKEVKSLDFDSDSLPIERALGVHWDMEEDMFGIKITPKVPVLTRRGLLRILSSVYDPMGFVCPFVLLAKKIFQSECKSGRDWDDELCEENIELWKRWLNDLPSLEEFKVPRCVIPKNFDRHEIQLHHFCDA